MIRCIIVDDEPLALEVLEHFISHTPQLELVAKCGHALDAFKVLHDQQVDLMFLDIKMPGISGLDPSKTHLRLSLRQHSPNMLSKDLNSKPLTTCSNR
jgi:YesN/AraC family two-component response regulator